MNLSKTWTRSFGLLACVFSIAAASGCTGTDVLSTGNSAFTISIEIANPETRHDFALFTISAINIRPNGTAADAALGAAPIGIIATSDDLLNIDLNDVTLFEPTTIRLSTGSYRIDNIEMTAFAFVDFGAPFPAVTCDELLQYPVVPAPVQITASDLGNPNLTVTEGGNGTLTIQIDGAALTEAFENAWTMCDLFSGANPSDYTFDEALFAGSAPSFITLQ